MKSDSLSKLEKNVSFKKKHLPKYFWLKNGSVYLPFLVLFFALFGLVYLLNYDMLLTVRAIPFALLFVIGAIWLKVAKREEMKKLLQNENSYLVCRAIIFLKENDLSYLIFTNGNKRHNEYFIENLTNDLMTGNFNDTDDFNKLKSECRKKACPISLENVSEPVYIYAVKNETIMKNLGLVHIEEKESVPILYIDDKNIQLLKKKDVIY